MHPAYSVIFFTTASGAGYGLLIWIGLVQLFAGLPEHQGFRWAAFIFAFGLVTAGLLASTAHLGRPERAWRAFSQWQTSWLSREGVAAVFTYVPAGLLAIWALFGAGDRAQGLWSIAHDRRRGRDSRLHRHDLCLTDDDPRLERGARPAGLSRSRAGNRRYSL